MADSAGSTRDTRPMPRAYSTMDRMRNSGMISRVLSFLSPAEVGNICCVSSNFFISAQHLVAPVKNLIGNIFTILPEARAEEKMELVDVREYLGVDRPSAAYNHRVASKMDYACYKISGVLARLSHEELTSLNFDSARFYHEHCKTRVSILNYLTALNAKFLQGGFQSGVVKLQEMIKSYNLNSKTSAILHFTLDRFKGDLARIFASIDQPQRAAYLALPMPPCLGNDFVDVVAVLDRYRDVEEAGFVPNLDLSILREIEIGRGHTPSFAETLVSMVSDGQGIRKVAVYLDCRNIVKAYDFMQTLADIHHFPSLLMIFERSMDIKEYGEGFRFLDMLKSKDFAAVEGKKQIEEAVVKAIKFACRNNDRLVAEKLLPELPAGLDRMTALLHMERFQEAFDCVKALPKEESSGVAFPSAGSDIQATGWVQYASGDVWGGAAKEDTLYEKGLKVCVKELIFMSKGAVLIPFMDSLGEADRNFCRAQVSPVLEAIPNNAEFLQTQEFMQTQELLLPFIPLSFNKVKILLKLSRHVEALEMAKNMPQNGTMRGRDACISMVCASTSKADNRAVFMSAIGFLASKSGRDGFVENYISLSPEKRVEIKAYATALPPSLEKIRILSSLGDIDGMLVVANLLDEIEPEFAKSHALSLCANEVANMEEYWDQIRAIEIVSQVPNVQVRHEAQRYVKQRVRL